MDDVKGLLDRAHAYVPFNHFKDGPLVAELATALTSLSRELAEARAALSDERDARLASEQLRKNEGMAAWGPIKAAEARALAAEARIKVLEAEVARVRSDREYIIGFNAGWDEAAKQNATKEPT